MTFNVELAKQVRELIRQYPDRHDQNEWSTDPSENPAEHCGTKACLAGWTAAALGFTVAQVERGDAGIPQGYEASYEEWGGGYIGPDDWAAEKLGLTDAELNRLFYCYDNEEALRRFDEKIKESAS